MESRPPFRADHVGSLLRPAELKALRDRADAGEDVATQLTAAEDGANVHLGASGPARGI